MVALQWQLASLFQNNFPEFLRSLHANLYTILNPEENPLPIEELITQFQILNEQMEEASSYVACLISQDVSDKNAEQLQGQTEECKAQLTNLSNYLDHQLASLSEEDFNSLLKNPSFAPIAKPLFWRRQRESDKLNLEEETMITDLSVDGYHGWSQLYGTMIGQEVIPVPIENKIEHYSWGQAYNRLSDPERSIRKAVFESSNKLWEERQSLYANVLNHIAGFRLQVYQKRGWDFLKEPLELNRMSQKTLDTMWSAIKENKTFFADYLKRKKKVLKLDRLHWYDLEAPLFAHIHPKPISYDEAALFITEQFRKFSPKMADFAEKAFSQGWIEAEDRMGKRPGGFCTGFPMKNESRIFMTFSGTTESLFTLAHELGHAFHNEVIFKLPELARHFPMNLAETASTFAEMVVIDAAIKKETDNQQILKLLDNKLQRSIIFLFNIHARFLFETRFYKERTSGPFQPERLCKLMEEAQKEAYCNILDEYNPYFWASKMHFCNTEYPFYNFPYTFGYLFSTAIYHKALKQSDFEQTYMAILSDTGRLTSEELAKKHLGVDLKGKEFWEGVLHSLEEDARRFIQLSD
jgi:oligoendopeptidase F